MMSKPYLKLAKTTGPIGYVDVGAAGGITKLWSDLRPHTKIVAFEPNKESHEDLIKDNSTGVFILTRLLQVKGELKNY